MVVLVGVLVDVVVVEVLVCVDVLVDVLVGVLVDVLVGVLVDAVVIDVLVEADVDEVELAEPVAVDVRVALVACVVESCGRETPVKPLTAPACTAPLAVANSEATKIEKALCPLKLKPAVTDAPKPSVALPSMVRPTRPPRLSV